ncbi:ChrR-like protein with cupin domain [Kribbella amoyensis]|uniref:ChrR-like protein with cupin domain n=1 Tax=Kribbella amoyensis TaxID=996641 RepID=A0A561BS24_9ACTN|nr:cupin domain-containing protein [Kribbella amoyensis]TWD81685.1 ChrR-like protein with cupin domain [Kribbella amoyensis]
MTDPATDAVPPLSNEPDAVVIDDVEPTTVTTGIVRRGLPSSGDVLARVFDLAPGVTWPEVDVHDRDELIYVISGALQDHGRNYTAGTYLHYRAGSKHQPSTDVGVRILVFGPAHA